MNNKIKIIISIFGLAAGLAIGYFLLNPEESTPETNQQNQAISESEQAEAIDQTTPDRPEPNETNETDESEDTVPVKETPEETTPGISDEIQISDIEVTASSIVFKTLTGTVASGQCTLKITNGGSEIYTDTAEIIFANSGSFCAGFSVDRTNVEINSGAEAVLEVESSSGSVSMSAPVNIEL